MGFVRDNACNIFRFEFWNDDVCFFVWIYERCFTLLSNQWMHLITGCSHFVLSKRFVQQCNDHTNRPSIEHSHS